MNRPIILIACLIFIVGGLSETLSQGTQLIAANDKVIISNGGRTSSSFLKDETFLETIFSPDTVPHLNIAVLENALGDVFQDNMINILDLLRLRDIIIGRPPAPSMYELSEGDITHEGTINSQDLYILRDILLFKIGVPYLIDSLGGQVLGDGIILTIPPGAIDSAIVISIRRTSESEFAREMGVDTKGAIEDSAYFMASFEIVSSSIDFKLPVGAEVKLDNVPPCAYEGLNGLFAAVPDRDGDGMSELFLINGLNVNSDSLTLTAGDISVPVIKSISASALEAGEPLIISGSGFGDDLQSIVVEFVSIIDPNLVQTVNPSSIDDSTIILTTPGNPEGQGQVIVHNLQNGLSSDAQLFEILPPSPFSGDIRAIIIGYYNDLATSMDSLSADTLLSVIEDSTVRHFYFNLHGSIRSSIDSAISFYTAYPDSEISQLAPIASFVQTVTTYYSFQNIKRALDIVDCSICQMYNKQIANLQGQLAYVVYQYNFFASKCVTTKLCGDCVSADAFRETALSITDDIAAALNLLEDCVCRNCGGSGCDKCKDAVFIGFGPKAKSVTGGYYGGGFSTSGCCINIIRYKRNQCTPVPQHYKANSPVPVEKPPELSCGVSIKHKLQTEIMSSIIDRPHAGSIIKVTDAPVPYNIVGILNDNGKAFIPQVPMNTKITFSIYDPVSGLYDENAGTYTTGSTPGGFDRPILLFQPNTEIRQITMNIGDVKHDSVWLDMQRIDYLLNIGPDDTAALLNIGFSANARLSLNVEDPDGNIIINGIDGGCYSHAHLRFTKVGIYRLRVALGTSIQPGSFDLGVCYSPDKPLPSSCLCGNITSDTLYEEVSPYIVKCSTVIATNDTLTSESGVTIEFNLGSVLTADGMFRGIGTPAKPIILRHFIQAEKRISKASADKVKNGGTKRKEVAP